MHNINIVLYACWRKWCYTLKYHAKERELYYNTVKPGIYSTEGGRDRERERERERREGERRETQRWMGGQKEKYTKSGCSQSRVTLNYNS